MNIPRVITAGKYQCPSCGFETETYVCQKCWEALPQITRCYLLRHDNFRKLRWQLLKLALTKMNIGIGELIIDQTGSGAPSVWKQSEWEKRVPDLKALSDGTLKIIDQEERLT